MAWIRREVAKSISAVRKARTCILAIALAHVLAVTAGLISVHAGYVPALAYRDRLVPEHALRTPCRWPFSEARLCVRPLWRQPGRSGCALLWP